jgi:hypothetical protein
VRITPTLFCAQTTTTTEHTVCMCALRLIGGWYYPMCTFFRVALQRGTMGCRARIPAGWLARSPPASPLPHTTRWSLVAYNGHTHTRVVATVNGAIYTRARRSTSVCGLPACVLRDASGKLGVCVVSSVGVVVVSRDPLCRRTANEIGRRAHCTIFVAAVCVCVCVVKKGTFGFGTKRLKNIVSAARAWHGNAET